MVYLVLLQLIYGYIFLQDEIAEFLGSVISQSANGVGTDAADCLLADSGTKRKQRKRRLTSDPSSDVNSTAAQVRKTQSLLFLSLGSHSRTIYHLSVLLHTGTCIGSFECFYSECFVYVPEL